jgi:hypothetical protein
MNILSSIQSSRFTLPPTITVTTPLPAQSTIRAIGVSRSGQSMVFVNTSNQLFLSTDYGASFQLMSTMSHACNSISVSNDGTYILASRRYAKGSASGSIQLSSNSGTNWALLGAGSNSSLPNLRVFSSGISETGQYMFVSGDDAGAGIYVNNNFGAGTWTRPVTHIFTQGGAISSSGQHIITTGNDTRPPAYSSDFGVNFVLLTANSATFNGRSAAISGNGNYVVGTHLVSGGSVWYCAAPAAAATCTSASSGVIAMFNNDMDSDSIFSLNENGTTCQFIDRRSTGATSRRLMITTDNFQTATTVDVNISNLTFGIEASSSTKYMLAWNGTLNVLVNTLL